jgi:hypothetical protein
MTPKTPQERKKTEPGLGIPIPRINTAEVSRVPDSSPGFAPEKTGSRRLRDTLRREEEDQAEGAEASPASQRKERTPRPSPVTVDKVGDVKLARVRKNVPQPIAAKVAIEKAPLDTRSAFILSLIDGVNDIESLVDVSGMSAGDVQAILQRLARLGLISLP